MQQIGLSKKDTGVMETAKSLLAIPAGLKGFKLFKNRAECSSVYFHRDSKVSAELILKISRGEKDFATVFW